MFGDHAGIFDHLRSNVSFKTYSDSRLASLYLDNPDDFPFHMMVKVFNIILDPRFKLEEITFRSLWDIFEHISTFRRQAPALCASVEIEAITSSGAHACSVSPLAVSLVVDRMIEDRLPLDNLAKEEDWKDAYRLNVADYHTMSLVHSTWTPIARRALRRRVVVPYQQVDRFLLSPLCGPWVKEIIVYWTIDNGDEGATCDDVALLGGLWERMPQLRSMAFVSSLTWPSYPWKERRPPPFRVSDCLELIPNVIPHLEGFWLKHIRQSGRVGRILRFHDEFDREGVEEEFHITAALEQCSDADSLFKQLARLRSLKFLSIEGWGEIELAELEQHPAIEMVVLRLHGRGFWSPKFRFRVSRQALSLYGLSCSPQDLATLEPSKLSRLEKLELRCFRPFAAEAAEALKNCHSLLHLDFDTYDSLPPVGTIPPTLMYLKLRSMIILRDRDEARAETRSLCDHIRSLPHLRMLVLSGDYSSDSSTGKSEISLLNAEAHTAQLRTLIELCKERGIRFLVDFEDKSIHIY